MDEVNPMINEDADLEETREREAPQLRTEPQEFDPTAVLTTKRRVQVKLTGEKLLDPERGLPHLMKIGKKRLHISKNKSAYENLSNIVQVYQLWAHQLYPKAKFKDFIKLSQQLGRTDRILREYRKKVIRQELGLEMVGEDDVDREITVEEDHVNDNDVQIPNGTNIQANSTETDINKDKDNEDEIISQPNRRNVFVPEEDSDDDDLYSFANSTTKPVEKIATEDEIQRLETEQLTNGSSGVTSAKEVEAEFEKDEDAMKAMREEDVIKPVSTTAEDEEIRKLEEEQLKNVTTSTNHQDNRFEDDFEEDEDAMDFIREEEQIMMDFDM